MKVMMILIILATITGCRNQREPLAEFVFDETQHSSRDIHRYEFYDDGKIKTAYSTTYSYVAGVLVDSISSVLQYEYNAKRQITRIFDTADSSIQVIFYNEFDSLVADYTINHYGDTTWSLTKKYLNQKLVKGTTRILTMPAPDDFAYLANEGLRNYDTLFLITESIYEGGVHTKSLALDSDGLVIEETHLIYEGGRNTKAVTYSILGEYKYIKETTIYTDNNTDDPDEVTLGTEGDTIGFRKTIFEGENKVIVHMGGPSDMHLASYYDKRGKLSRTVFSDLSRNVKTVHSYKYDNNGNVIEETFYREKIDKGL